MINHCHGFYTSCMITFLRKRFIKNYEDINDPKVRIRHGIFVSIVGILLNTILVGLKLSAAFVLASNQGWIFSMALVGDAINNLGDLSSSLVSLIGFASSSKPADKEHPFGYQRMEEIASLIVAMIIVFAAATLLKQSITQLIDQSFATYNTYAYIVFICSIALKFVQTYLFYGFGKAIDSSVLKGVAMDSFLDIISSTVLLTGAIIAQYFSLPWLDGALGIAIGCFVFYSGAKMVVSSANVLLGQKADKEETAAITDCLLNVDGVLGVHDLIIHHYGASFSYIAVHIEVDATLSLLEAHEIAEMAEYKIQKAFHRDITIHVDPKRLDKEAVELEEEIKACLSSHYPSLSVHDFQIGHDKIHLDVLVPYGSKAKVTPEAIETLLKDEVSSLYHYQIIIDHPFDQE